MKHAWENDEEYKRMVDELNAFELEDPYPVTKAQKKAAAREKQEKRSAFLLKAAKQGPNVPAKERYRRGQIYRID